ncbi:hypothetical protein [Nostoc sp. DSM 114160]
MAHLPQQIISERIDDVVLLLEVMKKMGREQRDFLKSCKNE